MVGTIITGILAILAALLAVAWRRVAKMLHLKEEAIKLVEDLVSKYKNPLLQLAIERAILIAENWAEKELKKTGQKIAGSEKMQKAIQELKAFQKKLAEYGIDLNIGINEKAIEAKIQAIFERIKDKINQGL